VRYWDIELWPYRLRLFAFWYLDQDPSGPDLRPFDDSQFRSLISTRPSLEAQRTLLRFMREGLWDCSDLSVPEHWDFLRRRVWDAAFARRLIIFEHVRRPPAAVLKSDLTASPPVAPLGPAAKAPPAETEEVPKTWFEVKVVDEFGKPIDGLDVVFSQGSKQEKLTTDGAGVVRWEEVEGGSFASAKVANLASLREILKPRYAKGGERKMPDGADVTKVLLGLEDLGKSLSAEKPGILVIAKPLTRVRLIGMHFDTNKCFLLPSAMAGIRQVVHIWPRT
jgi:hypothetical protein